MKKKTTMMTNQMDAGRELDALVAEKVMGSKLVACMQCADWHLDLDVPNACNWSPSTDIAAAWQVADLLKISVVPVVLGWTATVCNHKNYPFGPLPSEHAKTAPLAICLAALKAVGYDPTPSP